MTKIKICGLFREVDIDYANTAMPDFIGFVIGFSKSRRSIRKEQARILKSKLNPKIQAVGVFVNAELEFIQEVCNEKIIDIVQLHGNEDEKYISTLREMVAPTEIWKAFSIRSSTDVELANLSSADRIVLDNGYGTGQRFDWSLITSLERPTILAGGLTPQNIQIAIERLHPWAIDLSSGVEMDGVKSKEKMIAAVIASKE